MSQIDVCDSHVMDFEGRVSARRPSMELSFVRAVDRLIAVLAAWREKRRTIEMLTRLSDCQLRDIGIDPAALYGERVGTIGEVHGDRFHGL